MKTNSLPSGYLGKQGSSIFLKKQTTFWLTSTYEKTRYLIQHHKANLQPPRAIGPGGEEAYLPLSLGGRTAREPTEGTARRHSAAECGRGLATRGAWQRGGPLLGAGGVARQGGRRPRQHTGFPVSAVPDKAAQDEDPALPCVRTAAASAG